MRLQFRAKPVWNLSSCGALMAVTLHKLLKGMEGGSFIILHNYHHWIKYMIRVVMFFRAISLCCSWEKSGLLFYLFKLLKKSGKLAKWENYLERKRWRETVPFHWCRTREKHIVLLFCYIGIFLWYLQSGSWSTPLQIFLPLMPLKQPLYGA